MERPSATATAEIFEDERGAVRLIKCHWYFVEEIPKKEIRDYCIANKIHFPETTNLLKKYKRFDNYNEALDFCEKL
jgi:hypothetical protein